MAGLCLTHRHCPPAPPLPWEAQAASRQIFSMLTLPCPASSWGGTQVFPFILFPTFPCKDSNLRLQAFIAFFWSKLLSKQDVFHTRKFKRIQSDPQEEEWSDHNFFTNLAGGKNWTLRSASLNTELNTLVNSALVYFLFFVTFYFDVISNLQKQCKNSIRNSHSHFTQIH